MTTEQLRTELCCQGCSWRAICGPQEIDRYLRQSGMLRRQEAPDRSLLLELLTGAAPQLVCPECGQTGLTVESYKRDDDWQDAVLCEMCRQPIPPERLEALPEATRCASCQEQAESGTLAEEPEYCPRCGAPLVLRVSRGRGVTRYKLFCTGSPPCRL